MGSTDTLYLCRAHALAGHAVTLNAIKSGVYTSTTVSKLDADRPCDNCGKPAVYTVALSH